MSEEKCTVVGAKTNSSTSAETTKKLINSPETSVDENLRGLIAVYPQLRLNPTNRFTTFQQVKETLLVAVLSGGGSGHEPFAAGYVGRGALSGAVSGGIFTSPPPSHILYAITYLHQYNKGGVLVVIPNYTGDRLNFGMAIEKAKNSGLKVESIIVSEDLASGQNSSTGARGMCGLTVVYKICGALAAEGADLTAIQETGTEIAKNMATFGVSLRACSLPGQGPLFKIMSDEMELGTGVHGEAGVSRAKLGSAGQVTALVLDRLVESLKIKSGSKIAAVVNNMGGTSTLEMNIVCSEIATYFTSLGVKLERLYSGHVMTCLDMHGFQINVLRIKETESSQWLRLLDASTDAPAWMGCKLSVPNDIDPILTDNPLSALSNEMKKGPELGLSLRDKFRTCLNVAAEAIISHEDELNKLDSGCGDGDCGTTLRNLAEAVKQYAREACLERPAEAFAKLSEIAETDMGGTSGGIYSLGFAAVSRIIAEEQKMTPEVWMKAWIGANDAIMKYGRAKPGDRTMVDTLVPAANAFKHGLKDGKLTKAIKNTIVAAEEGAASTTSMKAGAGRASYVGEEYLSGEDAGARGTALWIKAVLNYLSY